METSLLGTISRFPGAVYVTDKKGKKLQRRLQIISLSYSDISYISTAGRTPLHYAVEANCSEEELKQLLDHYQLSTVKKELVRGDGLIEWSLRCDANNRIIET